VVSSSNESLHKSLGAKGRAILAYFCAVNTATLSFIIFVAYNLSTRPQWPLDIFFVIYLFLDGLFSWFAILFTAALPAIAVYAFARRHRIHSIIYYIACGALIGAVVTIPHIYIFPGDGDYDPRPFLERCLWAAPSHAAIGMLGGLAFWYKAGRHRANTQRSAGGAFIGSVAFLPLSVGLLVVGSFWPFLWLIWSPNACITETRQKISNLSGFDFESTFTDCDVIAKWAYVRVLGSRAGKGEKTLLFEYDPNIDEIPEISIVDPTHIVITIPLVSSIKFQMHDWGDVHIEYRIGRVIYE
jgi:hypothetical protein